MVAEVIQYKRSDEVKLCFAAAHDGHDIAIDKWERSKRGLYTSGAATCIVLAGYNFETDEGLMGHFSAVAPAHVAQRPPASDDERFDKALEALADLGDPRHTGVWLGGGAPFVFLGEDGVKADRTAAQELVAVQLEAMGAAAGLLDIRWSAVDHAIDVELDCHNGYMAVHDYPIRPSSAQIAQTYLTRLLGAHL
jgi:hypothetical protein